MFRDDEINSPLVPVTETVAESDEYLIEITTRIREDQAWALELLGYMRETSLGINFDKATLIRESLDLLIEKYNIRTGKWPEKRLDPIR